VEISECYQRSVTTWVAVVERATDFDAPTPCAGWSVREVVNHLVGEDRWTKPIVDGLTIADVGDRLDGDLLGSDPASAAREAAAEALEAVSERLPAGGVVHLSYGDERLEEYLRQLTADHLIHGWDVAAATGQDRTLDADVVSDIAAWYADREAMYRAGGAVADRPAGAEGGTPEKDLLIAFGRDPDWSR
jgi:uncharacterized protein (TIGR03086 family)